MDFDESHYTKGGTTKKGKKKKKKRDGGVFKLETKGVMGSTEVRFPLEEREVVETFECEEAGCKNR